MGKIIAYCGFDETSEEIWDLAIHAAKITGREIPNFLLIPTSAMDSFNPGTLNTFSKLGCNVDKLLLTMPYVTEDYIAERIRWADIISVPGGNLKYLMEIWTKTGALKYIREAYDSGKLLMGTSTGAMCWFEEGFDNCAIFDRRIFVKACGLKPYCICPHYESEEWKCFDTAVKAKTIPSIAIEDGAALCLIDGNNYIYKAKGGETCWYFDPEKGNEKIDLSYNGDILSDL